MALTQEQFKQLVNDFTPISEVVVQAGIFQNFIIDVLDHADPNNKLNEDFTESRLKQLLTQDYNKFKSEVQAAIDAMPNY